VSKNSKIEWTDATWNPVRGCEKVSEGCRNCYAARVAARFSGEGMPYEGLAEMTTHGPRWTGAIHLVSDVLEQPLLWRRPRRIFVNSMSDLFHEKVPVEFIVAVFRAMAAAQWHTFQILTKRPERMVSIMDNIRHGLKVIYPEDTWPEVHAPGWPLPNVWLGVSVENQKAADERIPLLLQTPAAVRFLSMEPLLGPVDLRNIDYDRTVKIDCLTGLHGWPYPHAEQDKRIHWVIVGGESGPGARPMHPDWVRSLRDQCVEAGVPLFFKQWGEWAPVPENTPLPRNLDNAGWFTSEGFAPHEVGAIYDGEEMMHRVGKKAAGRLLDGRTWDEFPGYE
jgi:protein gp37